MVRKLTKTIIQMSTVLVFIIALLIAFSIPFGIIPPLGKFLFPGGGLWDIPEDVVSRDTITAPSLSADVTVFRDEWGVPHIYGESEEDIVFALGYIHAQDRLFQMDMARRVTRGLLSEVVGEDALETDKFSLNKLKDYWAQQTLDEMEASSDPIDQIIYQEILAYSEGVNYYIKNMKFLPLEYLFLNFKPAVWGPIDTLSFIKYMSEDLSWSYEDLTHLKIYESLGLDAYLELFDLPYQIPITVDYGEYNSSLSPLAAFRNLKEITQTQQSVIHELSNIFSFFISDIEKIPGEKKLIEDNEFVGSNNWVIGENKSESSLPILCNDMHLGHDLPGIWYEAHLVNTDPLSDFNVYGFFLAGVPFPVVGHNEYIGWGFTNTGFDVIDWYYYNGINESHYWYKGVETAYTFIEYEIPVKNQDPVIFNVKNTVHGPVMTDFVDSTGRSGHEYDVIACKWIAHNVSYESRALYGWAHAKNRDDFNDASRYFYTPAQNTVYADIHGDIGIRPTGKVPIRDDSNIPSWHFGNGSLPYNGSAGNGEWIDYVPFDFLPTSENPDQNFLVSANQISAGPDYPYHLQHPLDINRGYRARRINNLIASGEDFTVEDMKSIQLDVYSLKAGNFTPYLVDVVNSISSRDTLQQSALDLLLDWDFIMDKEEATPAIFYLWIEIFQEETFNDEMRDMGCPNTPSHTVLEVLTKTNETSIWFDDINTPQTEIRDDIILRSFNMALQGLEDYFGTDDVSQWQWGEINTKYIPHLTGLSALAYGPVGVDGTEDTVNPVYRKDIWSNDEVVLSRGSGGASERMIIDFNNLNNSLSIIPSGERGITNSKHYVDQLEMFLRGEYHVQYFSADTVEKFQEKWIESRIYFKSGEN
ncbi:MAG: penicillin acylase family protein [Candidatus Heimdallarchaeota archaeon]|nr:penicillin acylase family protein [Candidatus Heimdallarchaeota archaeon]MCK4770891.1 penicillin acylase family protein [Candidatus Heimdallarchaeota archaeon]